MAEIGQASEADGRRAAQQELVVELLAAGRSYREVAEQVGVTVRTIGRWMSDPQLRRAVSQRRDERVGELTGRLASDALEVLEQVRTEIFGGETSSDRIRAATLYMRLLVQLRREGEYADRLAEIEHRLDVAAGIVPVDGVDGPDAEVLS